MTIKKKSAEMWKCPLCRHRFVTRNLWHSCSRHRVTEHFTGKDPIVKSLFRELRRRIQSFGTVTVYAQKTRIVFQVQVRFVSVQARKHWLDGTIWLTQSYSNPNVRRIEILMPRAHLHHFRLSDVSQIDENFVALLRESYLVGCRAHLEDGFDALRNRSF
jgi:Domain of unknown function (DUF5655)